MDGPCHIHTNQTAATTRRVSFLLCCSSISGLGMLKRRLPAPDCPPGSDDVGPSDQQQLLALQQSHSQQPQLLQASLMMGTQPVAHPGRQRMPAALRLQAGAHSLTGISSRSLEGNQDAWLSVALPQQQVRSVRARGRAARGSWRTRRSACACMLLHRCTGPY
jgi:hypothetical protein